MRIRAEKLMNVIQLMFGAPIQEFCGLRAKLYSIKVDMEEKKKGGAVKQINSGDEGSHRQTPPVTEEVCCRF